MNFTEDDVDRICFYLGYYTTQNLIVEQLKIEYNSRIVEYVLIILDKLDEISEPNPTLEGSSSEGYYITKVEDIEFTEGYSSSSTSNLSDPAYLIRLLAKLLSLPLAYNLFEEGGASAYGFVQVR